MLGQRNLHAGAHRARQPGGQDRGPPDVVLAVEQVLDGDEHLQLAHDAAAGVRVDDSRPPQDERILVVLELRAGDADLGRAVQPSLT